MVSNKSARKGGANTSQNSLPVEFGLGQAEQIDRITIRWPSGLSEWTTSPVAVDQFLTIEESSLSPVKVDEENVTEIPKEFALFQNYPNPFNPTTTIEYNVAKPGLLTLKIYNLIGQEIITLVEKKQGAGKYKIEWNGLDSNGYAVGTGLYFVRMVTGEFITSKKILLLK